VDTKNTSDTVEGQWQAQSQLWDEFLSEWPLQKLPTMSLQDYTQAGNPKSFTNWLEGRLAELGSIWGGSAFKFGIFSRKDKTDKPEGGGASYSEDYGWHSKYGENEEQAFLKVREIIVSIAEAAAQGDLEAIEAADLGQAVKWKIAFHYQDRSQPCIVNIFKKAPLQTFLGEPNKKLSMAELQRATLQQRVPDEELLGFGARIWSEWESKATAIWKLSHGGKEFSADALERLMRSQMAVMHRDTGKGQGKDFQEAPVGTLFYLCHGNAVRLLGRLSGEVEDAERGEGWIQRRYDLLKPSITSAPYQVNAKLWTPRGISTFKRVPDEDLPEFETTLLKPYFGIGLEDILELEPVTEAPQVIPEPRMPDARAPLNRILFGPPGTGKTYRSVAEAVAIIDGASVASLLAPEAYPQAKAQFDRYREVGQIEFVTFHPSYAYQDFVEGIRPQATSDGQVRYSVEPGVLKRIARTAEDNWRASMHTQGKDVLEDERFERAFARVVDDIEESEKGFVEAKLYKGYPAEVRVGGTEQNLSAVLPGYPTIYNAPKFQLKKLWARRAFIKRPADLGSLYNRSTFWAILKLLETADAKLGAPVPAAPVALKHYVLVIDEINRGNIAKIFGELITLIEDDKRLGQANELTVRLPYTPEEAPFGLPPNLFIVGTMNTADRSIALLDTALRRRFHFEELMPDEGALNADFVDGVDLKALMRKLNQRIAYLFDRDHTIGHAYFTGIKSFRDLEDRLRFKVIPLLQEYFFDDWSKIRLIFKDGPKKEAKKHIVCQVDVDAQLFDDELEMGDARASYYIAPKLTVDMVKAIYE